MRDLVKSFLVTLVILALTACVCGLAWYASQHPLWATSTLMPILGVLFVLGIWGMVHTTIKLDK